LFFKEVRNVCERNTVFVEDVTVAEIVLGETYVGEGLALSACVVWLIDIAGV
jgi:hypothetical protein